jgi:hypothetical protein
MRAMILSACSGELTGAAAAAVAAGTGDCWCCQESPAMSLPALRVAAAAVAAVVAAWNFSDPPSCLSSSS